VLPAGGVLLLSVQNGERPAMMLSKPTAASSVIRACRFSISKNKIKKGAIPMNENNYITYISTFQPLFVKKMLKSVKNLVYGYFERLLPKGTPFEKPMSPS